MRIALATFTSRRVGGTEAYLEDIAAGLIRSGHELALICEYDGPRERPQLSLPRRMPTWCIARTSPAEAIEGLRGWRPDLVYAQGFTNPGNETATLAVAPAILFAHGYYGTCITGAESHMFPHLVPCEWTFSPKCVLHFYPRRCGGRSPITALVEYRRQANRLKLLRRYKLLLTASSHMRDEYLRHGFEPERVIKTTYGVDGAVPGSGRRFFPLPERTTANPSAAAPAMERLRLLFLGRMEPLKGGDVLIAALPLVASALNRPVELTLGGDGSARDNWKTLSRRVAEGSGQLKITFEGWIRQERMKELCGLSDLLVIPSLWPEPFGRVGPQCGLYELPAVAFAVGGITDWLFEGVNGHLAPGNPGTAQGLAQAIVKCVQNPAAYERLRQGAITVARRFNIEDHVSELNHLFEQVVSDGNYSPAAG